MGGPAFSDDPGADTFDVSIVAARLQRGGPPARRDRPHPAGHGRLGRTPTRSSSSTTAPTTAHGEIAWPTIEGIRLIHFATQPGLGLGPQVRHPAARGRVVVWTDVDMTYPNDLIPELVKELDGFDQVVGARTSEQGTAKVLRVPAKWFIRKLASYLAADRRSRTSTPGCGPSAATSPCSTCTSCRPGSPASPRITMSFLANGYSVKYWPSTYPPGRHVEVPLVEGHPALPHSRSSA